MTRKVFVDCGANRGQSVERFRKLYPDHAEWEIFCFEPHADKASQIELCQQPGKVFSAAAWIANCSVDIYPGPSTLGTSMYADKITGNISDVPMQVPAIDLGEFLQNNFRLSDNVVLKLNVEGAEYPILRHLIDGGSIALVDRLFVQWHWMKIPSISEELHRQLVAEIESAGLKCEEFWRDDD